MRFKLADRPTPRLSTSTSGWMHRREVEIPAGPASPRSTGCRASPTTPTAPRSATRASSIRLSDFFSGRGRAPRVLSLGNSLENHQDLGDAETWPPIPLASFRAPTPSATCGMATEPCGHRGRATRTGLPFLLLGRGCTTAS